MLALTPWQWQGYRCRLLPDDALRTSTRSITYGWLARHPDACLIGLLLALGGLVRAAFWLRATVFIIPDSENYFLPGFELARGLGFGLEARRVPIYPAFIAAVVYGIGQDLASLALAQHALGLVGIAATYGLARVTFGRASAVLAGALVALNGSLLIAEQTVSTEAVFTPLLVISSLVAVLAIRDRSKMLLALAGVLLGLAGLARPVALGLIPALPLVLLVDRPSAREWLGLSASFGAGLAIVLLPWMIRNYVVLRVFSTEGVIGQTLVGRTVRHDRFVFVDPRAAADPDPVRQRARELMQEASNRGGFITPLRRHLMTEQGLTELQANQLMRDLALEAIARQPGYYALGTARFLVSLAVGWPDRLRDGWQSRREPDAREEWESHPEIAPLLGPPDPIQERQYAQAEQIASIFQAGRYGSLIVPLFGLGLVAAVRGPRARRRALLPGLWALALLLIGVAFVGPVLRYRYPAEPFLAVLAAGGLFWLFGACRERFRTLVRAPARSAA